MLLEDSQTISIASHQVIVYHTPGHSPGSCIYVVDDAIVFSGDSMIDGRKIITTFKGGNEGEMQYQTLPSLKSGTTYLYTEQTYPNCPTKAHDAKEPYDSIV